MMQNPFLKSIDFPLQELTNAIPLESLNFSAGILKDAVIINSHKVKLDEILATGKDNIIKLNEGFEVDLILDPEKGFSLNIQTIIKRLHFYSPKR